MLVRESFSKAFVFIINFDVILSAQIFAHKKMHIQFQFYLNITKYIFDLIVILCIYFPLNFYCYFWCLTDLWLSHSSHNFFHLMFECCSSDIMHAGPEAIISKCCLSPQPHGN